MRVPLSPDHGGGVPVAALVGEEVVDPPEGAPRAPGTSRSRGSLDLPSHQPREISASIQAQGPSGLVETCQQLVIQRDQDLRHPWQDIWIYR